MSRRHKHEDRLHNNEHQKWRLNNEREVNWQHRELSGLSYLEQVVARAAAILQFSAVIGSIPSIHQKVPCGGGRRCNAPPLWIPPVLLDYGTLWTDKKTKTAQAGFNRMSPNTDSLRSSSPLSCALESTTDPSFSVRLSCLSTLFCAVQFRRSGTGRVRSALFYTLTACVNQI